MILFEMHCNQFWSHGIVTVWCIDLCLCQPRRGGDMMINDGVLFCYNLGPISWMIFCHRHSNAVEILFCSHSNCREVIAMKFCSCHDSCTVLAYAKFGCDMIHYSWVKVKPVFCQIWIMMEKLFVKRTSCLFHTSHSLPDNAEVWDDLCGFTVWFLVYFCNCQTICNVVLEMGIFLDEDISIL